MSDSDSFINEVTEEVRRDQLYGYIRRYGWIAIVVVLLLVGGAAYNEYSKAQIAARAQAAGDALLTALDAADPAARTEALKNVAIEGPGVVVAGLIIATSQQEAGDTAASAATLSALASRPDVPQVYRDLASLKGAMLETGDAAARRATLETLAQPGGTFALIAAEQLALADLVAGDRDAAIGRLTAIMQDAGVTQGLRDRAQSLMVALGADLPDVVTEN